MIQFTKVTFTIIFAILNIKLFAQKYTIIKLKDAYSYQSIPLNHSFKINKKHYYIDSIHHLIFIKKPYFKQIIISSHQFETLKTKLKNNTNPLDTIQLLLIPNEAYQLECYKTLWNYKVDIKDTIIFKNIADLKTKINTYFNYLEPKLQNCDNGMCNYSNSYQYQINFTKSDTIFQISNIIKIKPKEYQCDVLEDHLKVFPKLFPYFILKDDSKILNSLSLNLFIF